MWEIGDSEILCRPTDATQGLNVEIGRLRGEHVVRMENMMQLEMPATDAAPDRQQGRLEELGC
jgi:hypothetical protein